MSSNAEATYRVAIIGCGKRAKDHVIGLKADPRVNVVALADAVQEAALAFNSDNGFNATIYTNYQELLAVEKPDVVIVTLWPPLHLPAFRDCAQAGVRAVLSEKPMAPTWGEAQEMGRIAEETGCILTFCHQRRFSKGNQLVRQLIAEGRFGKLERMELYSPPHLLDCGTHTVDQALSFNGETPVKWVLGAVDLSSTLDWFGVRAEGMAAGLIVFENGVRATFQTGGPDMDLWGGVRVTGSAGFIEVFWDGQVKRCVVYDEPGWQPPVIEEDPSEFMVSVVRNAIDCLESGAEPELSYRKALVATEVLFALYESVRRRERITLPLEDVADNPLHAILPPRP